jgi:hypothetical protein
MTPDGLLLLKLTRELERPGLDRVAERLGTVLREEFDE